MPLVLHPGHDLHDQTGEANEGDPSEMNDLADKQDALTDKARKMKPRLRRTLRKWTRILTKDLTPEEEETLRELLDKMTANAPRKGGIE